MPACRTYQLPALTGLRFILALWVVLHHLTGKGMMLEPWAASMPREVRSIIRGGYLAVSTFFVLSGFVLALGYRQKSWSRNSLLRYGIARLARIYPMYLLSLLIVSPFIIDYLRADGARAAPLATKVAMLAHYGFVSQGWVSMIPVHWNTPAWSLSCELFFYLCFPLAVICLGARTWPKMLLISVVATSIPTLLADFGVPWSFKPLYHMADFLLGIALAGLFEAVVQSGWRDRFGGFWMYAPASLLGLTLIAFPHIVEPWIALTTALRPVNATVLMGLALGGGFPARALSTRLSVHLGKASYSLYILHVPLLWWYKRSWFYQAGWLPPGGLAVAFVLGTVVISSLACSCFEEPANRLIRNWTTSRYPSR